MHLGVARLCLDCHEIHEHSRCPVCTSEAFAFITRWITPPDTGAAGPTVERKDGAGAVENDKIETYRRILQAPRGSSRAGKWLRNGSLLVAAGYLARWGWQLARREPADSEDRPESR